MTGTITGAVPGRRVSTRLKIGVILLPFVFTWFLLRRGYSTIARVLALGWLAIALLLFALPRPSPTPSGRTTPIADEAKPMPNQPVYVHELPLKTVKGGHTAPHRLSANGEHLRALWMELEGFKHDPKFHVLGFDNPFQYGEWRGKVRTLEDRAGRSLVSEIGLPPGELLTLGEEYRKNKGLRSEHSDAIVRRLDGALNPKEAVRGKSRVVEDTEGCGDFDMLARSLRQQEVGDFQASNTSLDAANCMSFPAGTVVSAPSRRRGYDWLKDKGQFISVLVRTDQGDRWLPEDKISF